jgi:hypothetical protein
MGLTFTQLCPTEKEKKTKVKKKKKKEMELASINRILDTEYISKISIITSYRRSM